MSYRAQYALAILVAMLAGGLGVVLAGAPEDYGLTRVAFRWLGVLACMLTILAGALPSWRKPPQEPRRRRD